MSNIETFRRQFLIISLLQSRARYLKSAVSTRQIYNFLCEKDIHVTPRMVQRDLLILQKAVPAVRRRKGNPAGWTFVEHCDNDDDIA